MLEVHKPPLLYKASVKTTQTVYAFSKVGNAALRRQTQSSTTYVIQVRGLQSSTSHLNVSEPILVIEATVTVHFSGHPSRLCIRNHPTQTTVPTSS